MIKKGLDIEKLKKFQDRFDNDIDSIKQELERKLNSIGGLIYEKVGINPDRKQFINWFLDNHYKPQKRSFPLKFSDELLLEFCIQFKNEAEQSMNLLIKKNYEEELKNNVTKIFMELFQYDSIISEKNISILIEEALYVLKNLELPKNILPLPKKDIESGSTYVRYCYYQIQSLKTNQDSKVWLIYLHTKFQEIFSNNPLNLKYYQECTTYKKFAHRPNNYPKR